MNYNRLLHLPFLGKKSFFLFGPRGTGKTYWLKKHLKDALYFDLLDSEIANSFLAYPKQLEQSIPAKYKNWIIIDEVQKAPILLNEIHRLIENKQYKFILTGSSARRLKRQGTNLLAGRALTYHLYPLTALELGKDFSLNFVLKNGCLPSIFHEKDPYQFLKAYIQTYLKEEVQQEGFTRNIGGFSRFLEIASFSQGCVMNASEIAREAAVHQKVVMNYFQILEDLLLSYTLPPFTKRAKRRLITKPKFYYFDTGIYQTLRPKGPLDRPEEIAGAGLETLFLQNLKAINDYFQYEYQFYFWRTSTGLEVDFIAYGKKGIKAFEIKHTKNISKKDLTALYAFKKDYPMTKLYLLYRGERRQYFNDVEVIPFEEALLKLKQLLT